MGGEADDVGSLCTLAQTTGGAVDALTNSSGAGDDGVLAHLEVGALLVRLYHDAHGQVGEVGLYLGSMGEPVGAHVDGEALSVGASNGEQVGSGEGLVGIGEATLALVRCDQLRQLGPLDVVVVAWQVAHLVVAPQLTLGQLADGG